MAAETKRTFDPDIVTIEQLADILHCSVDRLRRVPLSELHATEDAKRAAVIELPLTVRNRNAKA